jgi:hypothetical protein
MVVALDGRRDATRPILVFLGEKQEKLPALGGRRR